MRQYRTQVTWGDRVVDCATPEGLVILKLYALQSFYRQGKFDREAIYEIDIFQLALKYDIEFEKCLEAVFPHIDINDFSELRTISIDIYRRIIRAKPKRPTSYEQPTDGI